MHRIKFLLHCIACVCTKNIFVFTKFYYLRKSSNDKGFKGMIIYEFKILSNMSETIAKTEVLF